MKHVSTAQFAAELGISPQTLLKANCKQGGYFNVVPVKQANGRLIWPVDALEKLKGGAA